MQTFEEVLTHFHSFLESATYLDVVPCRWGYVRLFNEGNPINFNAILCRTPQELYTALANDLETELNHAISLLLNLHKNIEQILTFKIGYSYIQIKINQIIWIESLVTI